MARDHADRVTLAPWMSGCLLVSLWDATCPDTLIPSYTLFSTQEPIREVLWPPAWTHVFTHNHWDSGCDLPKITDPPERFGASPCSRDCMVSPSPPSTCSSGFLWRISGGTVHQCWAAQALDIVFTTYKIIIFVIKSTWNEQLSF